MVLVCSSSMCHRVHRIFRRIWRIWRGSSQLSLSSEPLSDSARPSPNGEVNQKSKMYVHPSIHLSFLSGPRFLTSFLSYATVQKAPTRLLAHPRLHPRRHNRHLLILPSHPRPTNTPKPTNEPQACEFGSYGRVTQSADREVLHDAGAVVGDWEEEGERGGEGEGVWGGCGCD